MKELKAGAKAPDFALLDQDGKKRILKDFAGKWLILYFYPKDDTSGCTVEAVDFTKFLPKFQALNTNVVGISPDDKASHCKFIAKYKLVLTLLSDPDHQVADKYAVWRLKNNMGKEYMGILRSTFLLDPKGIIAWIEYGVTPQNHAQTMLKMVKAAQSQAMLISHYSTL